MRRLPLLLLAACGVPVETDVVTTISGVCADGPFLVVTLQTCLSSSCDTVVADDCGVVRADGALQVSASATIDREQGECTDDCGLVALRCELPANAAATETVTWGTGQGTLGEIGCESTT
jgi:hypothetical protein